jgi:formate dehydrogenase subunit delta
MSHDKLVYMANQIGKFFASQSHASGGEQRAVDGIATHLTKFWDPSMRTAIIAQLRDGRAEDLDRLPRLAVEQLAASSQAHTPGNLAQ